MKPKNTICLWFDKDALDAARFHAATFPGSEVTAVHRAPGDHPGGKQRDVPTVEFTVLGLPCLGLTLRRATSSRHSPGRQTVPEPTEPSRPVPSTRRPGR